MLFFKEYLIDKYNKPLYRIPIDLPLSCPHRVTGSGKGCLFCPEDGARARHLKNNLDLKTQVTAGINYVRERYGKDVGLIAYFQSFTSTNAPLEQLKKYYSEVLSYANFDMVIISTRPDSIPDDTLEYLSELNDQYPLWIELGVQSANDKTLEIINRQHDFQCVKDIVAKLAKRNIKCACHTILGLPGETTLDFQNTAKELSKLPFSAIKIHNLLILKKTPLAKIYHKQQNNIPVDYPEIQPLNEYEYGDALIEFLKYIPKEWPLMRITADAPSKDIIAPKWWMKKGQFIDHIRERQDNPNSATIDNTFSTEYSTTMPKVKTQDGSYTLYHPEYKQHFHSLAGANSEAEEKFLKPCEVRKKLKDGESLTILDIGFGLGNNALAVIDAAKEILFSNKSIGSLKKQACLPLNPLVGLKKSTCGPCGSCELISLERDEKTLQIASQLKPNNKILQQIYKDKKWSSEYASIELYVGDARETINKIDPTSGFYSQMPVAKSLIQTKKFDMIFLDPFSHEANPELWSFDFLAKLAALLNDNGVIVTYSAAFPVRGALLKCGLTIGETPSFGRKKGGTIASFASDKILSPLTQKEMNILTKSTAGVPYRDKNLNKSRDQICEYRNKVIKKLQSMGIPKWWKKG